MKDLNLYMSESAADWKNSEWYQKDDASCNKFIAGHLKDINKEARLEKAMKAVVPMVRDMMAEMTIPGSELDVDKNTITVDAESRMPRLKPVAEFFKKYFGEGNDYGITIKPEFSKGEMKLVVDVI